MSSCVVYTLSANKGSIRVTPLFTTGFIKLIYSRSRPSLRSNSRLTKRCSRLYGQKFWLYGAVDPYTNEILHISLYPTINKQTARWFLIELHRRYQLNDVEFLVDDADNLGSVLAEDGCRFLVIRHGSRSAIKNII